MMGSSSPSASAREEAAFLGVDLRMLAARTATGALARAAVGGGEVEGKAARFEECIRSLEAEKAKMEVFRRELPISVHLVADVIEWLKDELEQQQLLLRRRRRRAEAAQPELFAPPPSVSAKRKAAEGVKAEADANDKRSWMSSAQLWSGCGSQSHTSTTSNSNGGSVKKQQHKVSNAFMSLAASPAFAKSLEKAGGGSGAGATPFPAAVPDLSLSSPATTDAPCPAAPSATSSAVTDAAGAAVPRHQQQQPVQRKARRCWSPELHRRFVAALQRLGGPQAATPKQIRELMKVDGLTNDEVKSHLQKYRLHTRRASDGSGDHQTAGGGLWPPPEQYTTSQNSTSQSGSPQGPLQLTVSPSHAVSVTAGDSCDGEEEDEDEDEGDGSSESYSWEMQNGAKASSSS